MNVSIDHVWSLKEEPSRGNNWKSQEIRKLLRTIKANDMMRGGPSLNQLGHLIEPLLGSTRSAFQITGKLKNLRKAYLRCLRKGRTPAALSECPYYEALAEIYKSPEDSGVAESIESEDAKLCSERGIARMFGVIEELKLGGDLTLRYFSGRAIRLVSETLIARGVCAPVDKVKSTLVALRKSYLESRNGGGEDIKNFRHYDYLQALWGSASLPSLQIRSVADSHQSQIKPKQERDEHWSDEETVVLLTSVKTQELPEEVNGETAAMRLSDALREKGYSRSGDQILRKLHDMRNSFERAKCAKSEEDAVERFPLYRLYDCTFGSSSIDGNERLGDAKKSEKFMDKINNGETVKCTRSRGWSDDETLSMLDLLHRLNLTHLAAHRLSYEVAKEIVEPLALRGYERSAIQIQIKLRNLRKAYHQCVKDGCTQKAIAECPFYEKLDFIFGRKADTRRKASRKMMGKIELGEGADYPESYNDHCYFNGASVVNDKQRVLPKLERRRSEENCENGTQVWLPIETIPDEDDENVDEEAIFREEQNSSGVFEVMDETEMYSPVANESNSLKDLEDPLDESTIAEVLDNEDNIAENNVVKCLDEKAKSSAEQTRRRSSRLEFAATAAGAATTLGVAARRTNGQNGMNPCPRTTDKDSAIVKSIKIIMAEVLRHEKLLQRQHHAWMERQFEMQKKYDRDQRELLLKELREFRKWLPKQQNNGKRS